MKNLQFAYSTDPVTNPKSINQVVSFDQMIDIIKGDSPAYYPTISNIVINGLNSGIDAKQVKKQINPLKIRLPYFLFSGTQAVGHNNKDIRYNGCVQIDIDFKVKGGNVKALAAKNKLSNLPYVALVGISPSGVGVKALVRTNNMNKERHVECLGQVMDLIQQDTGISKDWMDSVGASQPVFVFFDKDLYVNSEATVFMHKPFKQKKVRTTSNTQLKAFTGEFKSDLKPKQIEKGLTIAYNCAKKRRGQTVDTTFLQTYCGVAITFGILPSDALSFLKDAGHSTDLNNKRVNSFFDLYRRYGANFGTAEISYDIEDDFFGPITNYKLNDTQKLSDIDLDLTNNALIVSPTGSGKSYYVGNKLTMKRVMVVPTQSLVKQFAKEYNATPFFADAKEINDDNFIVTTYKSFNNLCELINPSDYTLFIDEAHNFTASTSHTFLLKELNEVIDLVHCFKNYYLMTATPLFSLHEDIKDLNVLKVQKNVTHIKNVYDVRYADLYKTLQLGVEKTVKNNGQFVILSNNTKEEGRLGRIKAALSKYNIVTINSTKKDQDSYIEVAIDGDMSNCQGIVTTSIIKEGNSITQHNKLINVFIDGNFHPAELEQFTARFRNAKMINLYILKSNKSTDTICNFNLDLAVEELTELVNNHKEYAKTIQDSTYAIREQLQLLDSIDKYYFRQDGLDVVVDTLSLSNIIFNKQKQAANLDYDYMAQYLAKFSFNNKGSFKYEVELTDKEQQQITDIINLTKEQKQDHITNLLDVIKEDTAQHNEELIEQTIDPVEKDLRYKVNYINKYQESDDLNDSVTILNSIGFTTQAWTTYTQAVTVQKIKTDNRLDTSVSKFVNEVYSSINVGDVIDNEKVVATVNSALMSIFNTQTTKNKALKIFKTFFGTKKHNQRINNKVVSKLKIVNDNPTLLDINTTQFVKTIEPVKFEGLFAVLNK